MKEKKTYQFSVDANCVMKEAVEWTLRVFAQYASVKVEINNEGKGIKIGGEVADIVHSISFWSAIKQGDYSSVHFDKDLKERKGDILGTAFYFINCLWERDAKRETDHWGRSEFSGSIWKEFGYKRPFCHVNKLFDALAESVGIAIPKSKSTIFLSHDIDAVFSAWMQDGKAALLKGDLAPMIKGVQAQMTGKPAWFNFKEIVGLESEYGVKSTFYWITTDKSIKGVGKNADYKILSPPMQKVIHELSEMGASHGVHKSIDITSLKEEVGQVGVPVDSNRYHYLKYTFSNLIKEVNESGLKMDASLGYAEVYGYRNGYSLPFVPFDLENNAPASFIEVPLTIMDATFSRYFKMDGSEAIEEIKTFLKEHENNAVISVLWHNTHFTDYKYQGYPKVYEDILALIKAQEIETVSPSELINKYLD